MEDSPLWYKDAILYEVPVRAFKDSDGNGVGDFRGLIEKLDYLADLGITTIWLLPFYPSPLKDDGYDIADYVGVHPTYGTMQDVRSFVREAHRRNLRVVTELVVNHTSDQHPWFQRARRAPPGSSERNFYVWSDTPNRYQDARIIFKDFESSNWIWDPLARAYYWHRFYSHQPDLNYDNPRVQEAVFRVTDFWLRMGVDGLRLDAVPYLFEREGTSCENLPETHAFLKKLRAHIDARFAGRMLLAEANQWPEDAVAYFGSGDECHMAFHFPVMPRLFMAIQMEDRFPIVDIMTQTPPIPENAQWALFLRNHDELTLEMVTDEERDYMYRVYAHDTRARINLGIRRRLAPLLGNNRRRIELMKGLLFSLPGTPVLYYGDEIGMGDNIYLGDRNGVRTPMQWSPDRNAGFSSASSQQLYLPVITEPEYYYAAVNVESQLKNPQSLLWWIRRLIDLRKRHRAFGRGSLEFVQADNRKVLAFIRRYQEEQILVVANLSRFVQPVELDLAAYRGARPVEMFGQVEFPPVADRPYFLTLGPHSFYWFVLEAPRESPPAPVAEPQAAAMAATTQAPQPSVPAGAALLTVPAPWDRILHEDADAALSGALLAYLRSRPWFTGSTRVVSSVRVLDAVSLPGSDDADPAQKTAISIVLAQISYRLGGTETYTLPLAYATRERADRILRDNPQAVIARLRVRGRNGRKESQGDSGILYDALSDRDACEAMLRDITQHRRLRGAHGDIYVSGIQNLRRTWSAGTPVPAGTGAADPASLNVQTEGAKTLMAYDSEFVLRVLRRLEAGTNPELEMERFLTRHQFPYAPSLIGALRYQATDAEPMVVALLTQYVPAHQPAWDYTIDNLSRFFEHALAAQAAGPSTPHISAKTLLELARQERPPTAHELIGPYLESIRLLGERTAEMHVVLSGHPEDADFAPEPFTTLYQRSLYQSMRTLTGQVMLKLRNRQKQRQTSGVEDPNLAEDRVLGLESRLLERFRSVVGHRIPAVRIRCHDDYRLNHVLYTGRDFVITNFAGDPARPASEYRIKRSPLRDAASMITSLHYAADMVLLGRAGSGGVRPEDVSTLEPWAHFWKAWASAAFLQGYLGRAEGENLVPQDQQAVETLLDVLLLDDAIANLSRELDRGSEQLTAPLRAVLELMETGQQ